MKRKRRKKLKGIIHHCIRCKKRTEHYTEGEKWVNYTERCKNCNQVSYSEILKKDNKKDEY